MAETPTKPRELAEGNAAFYKQKNGTWTGFLKLDGVQYAVILTEQTISEKTCLNLKGVSQETGQGIASLPFLYKQKSEISAKTQGRQPDYTGEIGNAKTRARRRFSGWLSTAKDGTLCISGRLAIHQPRAAAE